MVTKSGSLDDYNKLNLGYDFKGALLNKASIESTEHVYRAGDGVFYKLITGTSVPYVHDGTDAPNMTYFEEVSQKATSDKLENLYSNDSYDEVTGPFTTAGTVTTGLPFKLSEYRKFVFFISKTDGGYGSSFNVSYDDLVYAINNYSSDLKYLFNFYDALYVTLKSLDNENGTFTIGASNLGTIKKIRAYK